jgi:hypothetical protein
MLLFRKSFFTIEGILHDLDPQFDMDAYLTTLLRELAGEELPKRLLYHAFPYWDRALNYKSRLSNAELPYFLLRLLAKVMEKRLSAWSDLAHQLTLSTWTSFNSLMWSFSPLATCAARCTPAARDAVSLKPCNPSFSSHHRQA